MDKLTKLVLDYKKTKNEKLIKNIQYILTPIILRLLFKWHFTSFPKFIYLDLLDDAKSVILTEVLQRFKFTKRRNCKFTSYYATALDFYLRRQYMGYFQKGKPIQKRWGRIHEVSLEAFDSVDSETDKFGYLKLLEPKDTRRELLKDMVTKAISNLKPQQRKLVDLLYFRPIKKRKILKMFKMTYPELQDAHNQILQQLATQM